MLHIDARQMQFGIAALTFCSPGRASHGAWFARIYWIWRIALDPVCICCIGALSDERMAARSPCAVFLKANMIVTTTPSIEGKRITRYCGVVAGEAILGANVFKDFFAGIRDIVGGRSGTYERELQKAREIALKELEQRAAEAGANAVVGVDLDFEVLGQGNGMLMVSASGTAVVVE
jgi:uncharacterized protein YbjQ (UPF0145 family)